MDNSFETDGFEETEESNAYYYQYWPPTREHLIEPYDTGPYVEHVEPYQDEASVIDPSLVAAPENPGPATPAVIYGSYAEDPTWSEPGPSSWPAYVEQAAPFGGLDNDNNAYTNVNAHPYSGDGDYYNNDGFQPSGAQAEMPNPALAYHESPPSNHDGFFGGPPSNTAAPAAPRRIEPQHTPTAVEEREDTVTALPVTPVTQGAPLKCQYCSKTHRDTKGLARHEQEVHNKPAPGTPQVEWYPCTCGKTFVHYRKSNYTRHRGTCRPSQRTLPAYRCQCGRLDDDDAAHEAHYLHCREGRRRVGRPSGAGAANGAANTSSVINASVALDSIVGGSNSSGDGQTTQAHVYAHTPVPQILTTHIPQTPQTPLSQFSGATEDFHSPPEWSPSYHPSSPYPEPYRGAGSYELPRFLDG